MKEQSKNLFIGIFIVLIILISAWLVIAPQLFSGSLFPSFPDNEAHYVGITITLINETDSKYVETISAKKFINTSLDELNFCPKFQTLFHDLLQSNQTELIEAISISEKNCIDNFLINHSTGSNISYNIIFLDQKFFKVLFSSG